MGQISGSSNKLSWCPYFSFLVYDLPVYHELFADTEVGSPGRGTMGTTHAHALSSLRNRLPAHGRQGFGLVQFRSSSTAFCLGPPQFRCPKTQSKTLSSCVNPNRRPTLACYTAPIETKANGSKGDRPSRFRKIHRPHLRYDENFLLRPTPLEPTEPGEFNRVCMEKSLLGNQHRHGGMLGLRRRK